MSPNGDTVAPFGFRSPLDLVGDSCTHTITCYICVRSDTVGGGTMSKTSQAGWIIFAAVFVALVFVVYVALLGAQRDCQERGGEYLRTVIGYECVTLERD